MILRVLLMALLLAGSSACQRGARLDLELMVSHAVPDTRVLAMPIAIELIDARGLLFRLPVAHRVPLDLVAIATVPVRLPLCGQLPPGQYIGLRLVFDDRIWFERPGAVRVPLAVDQISEFARLDLDLEAGSTRVLSALLDLDASLIRRGPFNDILRFLPRLSLIAARDAGPSSAAATEVAAMPRFMVR